MNINIGSKNRAKIEALEEILKEYPHLAAAHVISVETNSGIADQPKSLEETMQGAINRAKGAWNDCDYSIGLESGLMHVPLSKTGYMDVCVCAIYDGKDFHFGLSSAWEFPNKKVLDYMLNEGLDMSQAINKAGMTTNPKIGSEEGAIGILTKGRLTRKAYTTEALRTALIHIDP
ncbi:MAG TPA: inosine/xanthosine triphosphatase [Candidatus Paceibacterota bacterium]|nr:inosine/xanthosine triphosphatase [Candidatus Paceibacterota bacterium]